MTGSGTAGAYHAGVLRALREAGVKIDLVAGRGVGVVGAMFSAVDGGTTLWQAGGVWRSSGTRQLYAWRKTLKAAAWTLVVALSALLVPLMAVVGAAVVYPIGFVLRLSGLGLGDRLALGYTRLVELAFQTDALPLVLPRFVMVALLILLCILGDRRGGPENPSATSTGAGTRLVAALGRAARGVSGHRPFHRRSLDDHAWRGEDS